jgi:hypothetical protein
MIKHAGGVDVAGVEAQEQWERITDFVSCCHLCVHADRRAYHPRLILTLM